MMNQDGIVPPAAKPALELLCLCCFFNSTLDNRCILRYTVYKAINAFQLPGYWIPGALNHVGGFFIVYVVYYRISLFIYYYINNFCKLNRPLHTPEVFFVVLPLRPSPGWILA